MKHKHTAFTLLILWMFFPFLAAWIMVTHPGKCIKVWKMELTDSWWK